MNKLFVRIGIFSIIVFSVSCGGDSSPGFEFMPNMYRSPSIETYGEHNIDGYTGIPVEGTISRGHLSTFNYGKSDEKYKSAGGYKLSAGDTLINYMGEKIGLDGKLIDSLGKPIILKSDTVIPGTSTYPDSLYTTNVNGKLESIPFLQDDSIGIAQGTELYGMMCAHCHGSQGGGDGLIAKASFANNPYDVMPAFNDSEQKRPRNNLPMTDFTEGHIFHTITYGYGKMGPHASQISEKERWKIVYYIQEKLQK